MFLQSSIPKEVVESVKVDGGNDMHVLWHIIVPLSKAVISVMVLFYGVSHWNSWFSALLYIDDRGKFPLQLVLREILLMNSQNDMLVGQTGSDRAALSESIKYATIIVATLPILIVYPLIQKYFVSGVMVGAVKG